MEPMVFKKLLSSLGFGGVEVDTILAPTTSRPGEALTGHVNLRAKSDVDITAIHLLIVTSATGRPELGLARYPVSGPLHLPGGSTHAVPFSVTTPHAAPVTLLYGHRLPGLTVGVRTEVAVASGSAKTDFDPVGVEPTEIHQHVLDALGTIGCRFVRTELRAGGLTGLSAPSVQAITFYAPVPEGQQVGPHIPQLVFSFAPDADGMAIAAELAGSPASADLHRISLADAQQLGDDVTAWIERVDEWVRQTLDKLTQAQPAAAGAFMQQPTQAGHPGQPGHPDQPGYGPPPRGGYAYAGHQPYRYGGYRGGGMGGAIAAGVGGAALGFLGGMLIGNMIGDAMTPDAGGAEAADAGAGDAGAADAGTDAGGYEDPGYDAGGDYGGDFGGDFGGGDFGGF